MLAESLLGSRGIAQASLRRGGARHLSLVELGPADCRYPYGGDSEGEVVTYCGHPRQSGSSYCTPHFELSRNPKLLASPVLSIDWLRAIGAI
ncbi:GcrA family cell cycle regulator [Bradyrhizobium sp. LTSPM299]|uniref:GcrA family cell cycle regulator n=1 Tax=Bradyrhizobium sp. LTSPM299 TaxID=1619233 RepID=UPI0006794EC8|nr:GcrA family cell cycle regulator [Bradyrhizobium sp. LTSPM299]